jgi:ATP-dependent Clp protease ATP-binding subunit ClpC
MQKMIKLPFTPHLQGIIEDCKLLSVRLNKSGIDLDLFFYCFMNKMNLSSFNIFSKCEINTAELTSTALSFVKKGKSKVPSDHFLPDLKRFFILAENICEEQLDIDYISPESLIICFLSEEFAPKAIYKFFDIKRGEEILNNEIINDLLSETLIFCKDFFILSNFLENKENDKNANDKVDDWIDMFVENPILSKFAENLNIKAAEGKFDKIIDFDNKIDELATILCRKKKPNAILVGPAGTGKTSLVEGLALKIIKGEAPELLSNKVIYSINLGAMVAGTEYRGQFEKRLQDFVEEAKKYSNLILFIDEIHTLVGAGGGQNHSLEASNILKPELARGTISCIGATTIIEYTNTIKKDSALDRRFERVIVKEPSKFQMKEILPQIIDYYADFHNVKYSEEFVENVINFCERFTPNKFYPDKAIDVIDHCGAQAKVNFWEVDESIKSKQREIIEYVEKNGHFKKEMIEEMNEKMESWEKKLVKTEAHVKLDHLKTFFDKKTNPMNRTENNKIIFSNIKKDIAGQNAALKNMFNMLSVLNLSLSAKSSFNKPDCLLIYGPKLVGKTLFCQLIKDELQKIGTNVISYNGIEFSDSFAPYKIISDLNNNTSLAEKICIHPNSVIIIDDFDKVNPSCFGLFCQILKEGRLQMNNGDIADFSNCKIFLTCGGKANVKTMGFNIDKNQFNEPTIEKEILDLITEKVQFSSLKKKDLRRILFNRLKKIQSNLTIKDIKLNFNFKFIKEFIDKNYSEDNCIEKLNSAIESKLIPDISSKIINGNTTLILN